MAKRAPKTADDAEETDRVDGFAHPRETFHLTGQGEALARAARAIRGRRPPQGWLISGPPGVGKATLAYRIARYMLKYGANAEGPADLDVPANDPVAVQVAARSHPGLLVLKRSVHPQTGRMMTVLSVDEVRRLTGFFGLTSGAGGWRVAIIDTADEMNDAAANALLKALEEPPPRAMLLLIANAPGRLLPTIRSRCQRLLLRPLAPGDLDAELARHLPELGPNERATLERLAGGSPGLALQIASGEGLALAKEADRLIDSAAHPDVAALMALADRIGRMKDGLETHGEFLMLILAERIRAQAREDAPGLKPWLDASETLRRRFAQASGLHLEPRQTILSTARTLSEAAHTGSLPQIDA